MTTIFRMASLGALLAGTAFVSLGCATECHDEVDPVTGETKRVCTAENLVHYQGQPVSPTPVAYMQGANILIDGANGEIDIASNGPSDQVSVTFHPFTKQGNDPEDKEVAAREMQDDLELVLTTDPDGTVRIEVNRSGDNIYLGADIDVILPSGYTGGIQVDVDNGFLDGDLGGSQAFTTILNDGAGDIDVVNAAGKLDISGKFDVNVSVSSWSAENGQVVSTGQLGDLTLRVPAGANGSIQAQSEDEVVVGPNPLPSDWVEDAAADNSKTFTFGDGSGGIVQANAAKLVTISQ